MRPSCGGGLGLAVPDAERLRNRKVIVVEDGPTLTHGGMTFGAATLVAEAHGAVIVDAQRSAVGSLADVYVNYPHLRRILPAMGYSPTQVLELEETIRGSEAEIVLDGSPVDLGRLVRVPQPIVPVTYTYDDLDRRVAGILDQFLARHPSAPSA